MGPNIATPFQVLLIDNGYVTPNYRGEFSRYEFAYLPYQVIDSPVEYLLSIQGFLKLHSSLGVLLGRRSVSYCLPVTPKYRIACVVLVVDRCGIY